MGMTKERREEITDLLKGLDPEGEEAAAILDLLNEVDRLKEALVSVGVEVLVDASKKIRQSRTKGHGRPERSS
jgi:hypothetical protein